MKPNTLKTVIIDDEPWAVNLLNELAKEVPGISVAATLTDPARALNEIGDINPDLLLLDVQMPMMSGFELLKKLRQTGIDPSVIFITAYDQFAIEAIHNEAFDYLMKPVSPDELRDSVQRLIARLATETESPSIDQLLKTIKTSKLQFSDRTGVTFLAPEEIIFVEADGNYSKVVTKTKIHLFTRKLGELEEMLTPLGFIRVGRSGIVNPAFLTRIDRKQRLCILQHENASYEISVSEECIKTGIL